MNNLFSSFDPSSSLMSLKWISIITLTIAMPFSMWTLSPINTKIMKTSINNLASEIKTTLGMSFMPGTTMISITLFMTIMMINSFGLIPYTFTPTSHLIMTFTVATSIWLSIQIFGWLINTKKMFAHLVPLGTPLALTVFMALIETVSQIIRPITLAVRLSANMIAGHLLITLISDTIPLSSLSSSSMKMSGLLALMVLESAVALIQAYVFTVLISLYSAESH